MNTSKGATARFGVAAVIALSVTLTAAHAQDYSNCPVQPQPSKATRDARTPCAAERQDDAYLQWALNTHRAALGSIYLTAQNPVAPRDTRTRDGRTCACGIPLSP